MSQTERLNEQVGTSEERYCGKCKQDRVHLFCKQEHFVSSDYFWVCTACKIKDYVKRG